MVSRSSWRTATSWTLLFLPLLCWSSNYYIDPSQGSDSASGTKPSSPWRSCASLQKLTFSAGDSVLFLRGTQAIDSLRITANGSLGKPVVISAYGNPASALPYLKSTGNLLVVRKSKYLVIEKLRLSGARAACVDLEDTTNNSIVAQDFEAFDCGGGVYASGKNISVRRSYIHDGHMVVNTQNTKDDDYGASGINLTNVNGCQIYGNRLENLTAPSFDYGKDGGAFEFWRSTRNCDIYGNFALNADGFTEFGGQRGDSIVSVSIHHNIAMESSVLGCFHVAGNGNLFGIGFDGLRLDNNLIIKRNEGSFGYHLIADGGSHKPPGRIMIRNNIMVSDSQTYFAYVSALDPKNLPFEHRYNLVWSPTLNPFEHSWNPGPGDFFANPKFSDTNWNRSRTVDTILTHYALASTSPAVGAGENLGYPTDFFGNPYDRAGAVEIGPFSLNSKPLPPNSDPKNDSFRILTRQIGGQIELQIVIGSPSVLGARIISLDGQTMKQFPNWSVESGQSIQRLTLPPSLRGTRILEVHVQGQTPSYQIIGVWSSSQP